MRSNQRSPEAEAYRAWYKTARWQRLRMRQLQAQPLCVMCKADGNQVTPAAVCDHVEPHRGDAVAFWSGPFQSLCAAHHNVTKQAMEKGGKPKRVIRIGLDGWPIGS